VNAVPTAQYLQPTTSGQEVKMISINYSVSITTTTRSAMPTSSTAHPTYFSTNYSLKHWKTMPSEMKLFAKLGL